MSSENVRSLQAILEQFLRERGLDKKLREHSVPDIWQELIGENAARVSQVRRFEHGQLMVEVHAPVWRTELLLRREEIRKKINERIGQEMVREIIIR
jgi:predicted nucleic acid-binding Zn ribbon protein